MKESKDSRSYKRYTCRLRGDVLASGQCTPNQGSIGAAGIEKKRCCTARKASSLYGMQSGSVRRSRKSDDEQLGQMLRVKCQS